MSTMKIARHLGNCEVVVDEVPLPQPGPGEVLIQTVASALCGSEMGAYRNAGVASGNSGHEAAGIVASLGEGVTNLHIGQHVGACPVAGCGECEYCQLGQNTWCDNRRFYGAMHAEYFLAAAQWCQPLPDDVPWDVGVLITGDGLGVPWHTSKKIASEEIQTVAIFGLGPVGLGNVLLQKHLGRRVIGIDRAPQRLEFARQMGAETIVADENTVLALRAQTGGKGADVCIEAAGSPITAKQCFNAVRKGGIVVFNGEQAALELSPSEDFIRRDITAIGSWFYHFSEFPEMLALYRGGLPVASLVTHWFLIDQIAEAYRAMAEGQTGKVIIEYA